MLTTKIEYFVGSAFEAGTLYPRCLTGDQFDLVQHFIRHKSNSYCNDCRKHRNLVRGIRRMPSKDTVTDIVDPKQRTEVKWIIPPHSGQPLAPVEIAWMKILKKIREDND